MKLNAVNCGLGLLVLGCIATAAHHTYVEKLTREVSTYPGYTNVILEGNLLDAVVHYQGFLTPGEARVSKDARLILVKDGRKGSVFSMTGERLTTKDGVEVNPWFEYDYKVLNAKLLIEKFSPSWVVDDFTDTIAACAQELASEHDASYFKTTDTKVVGLELQEKVNSALERIGMPVAISNMALMTPPYGGEWRSTGYSRGMKRSGMLRSTHPGSFNR